VLDALDIKRDHIRVPVYQSFRNPLFSIDANVDPATVQDVTDTLEPYAVSKCIKRQIIGPKNRAERLELLGFVVGEDPGDHGASVQQPLRNGFLSSLPDCTNRVGTQKHTGFHYLGGLYDTSNARLQAMRKSSPMPLDLQTQYQEVDAAGLYHDSSTSPVGLHSHKDWPLNPDDQAIKLTEDPFADSLYYHKTQIRFLLTGIDDVGTAASGDAASNHRGTVRMLVLRPRTPAIRTRVEGSSGQFILNHGFMPNWDTELFYDKNKQLGGKLGMGINQYGVPYRIEAHTSKRQQLIDQLETNRDQMTAPQIAAMELEISNNLDHPIANGDDAEVSVTYGLNHREVPDRTLINTPNSVHFGHYSPTVGEQHGLTPTDILMSKINKNKYAVLHDECFTLDSLHHGAGAQHIANVSIPYYKKVRFAGRQVEYDANTGAVTGLSNQTNNEPMNLASRPIVLFLSYNQKISASVEGFTAISET